MPFGEMKVLVPFKAILCVLQLSRTYKTVVERLSEPVSTICWGSFKYQTGYEWSQKSSPVVNDAWELI